MKSIAHYAQKVDKLQDTCPVRAALDVLRGRWKPSILFLLKNATKRFSELQGELEGINAQTLTTQLRQLEADGIVTRRIYAEIPARVEYSLSDYGATLSEVLEQLEIWGVGYLARRNQQK